MIVIITGCDCVGKTTLFNDIKKKNKEFLFYSESYCGKSIENRKLRLKQLDFLIKKGKKNTIIYDRCSVLEDHIYEPLINKRKSILDEKKSSKLLKKCLIVFLNLPEEIIIERLKKRGDEFVKEKDINLIKSEYFAFFKKNNINYIKIENDKNSYNKILKLIGGNYEK